MLSPRAIKRSWLGSIANDAVTCPILRAMPDGFGDCPIEVPQRRIPRFDQVEQRGAPVRSRSSPKGSDTNGITAAGSRARFVADDGQRRWPRHVVSAAGVSVGDARRVVPRPVDLVRAEVIAAIGQHHHQIPQDRAGSWTAAGRPARAAERACRPCTAASSSCGRWRTARRCWAGGVKFVGERVRGSGRAAGECHRCRRALPRRAAPRTTGRRAGRRDRRSSTGRIRAAARSGRGRGRRRACVRPPCAHPGQRLGGHAAPPASVPDVTDVTDSWGGTPTWQP